MPGKVRWGVLGTARVALAKVIPAMQRSDWSAVVAIASRDPQRAEQASIQLGIPTVYGSYEALLDDPSVEAVYIPLPNHLHVPWSIRAADAGKHVLCEKPLGLGPADVRTLIDARDRTGVKIQEAYMVRTHPQWLAAREMVRSGRLGELRGVLGAFGYLNLDPANIRNMLDFGGGALLDIGGYLVMTGRFVFGEEPTRVAATIDRDPTFHTDRLASILLEFPTGPLTGLCSTQMAPFQRMHIFGSRGRLEVEIPFNAPSDRPCRLFFDERGSLDGGSVETIEIERCDQYTIQGDRFSRAIREKTPVVYPLEESLANARVLDALFRSAAHGQWTPVTE